MIIIYDYEEFFIPTLFLLGILAFIAGASFTWARSERSGIEMLCNENGNAQIYDLQGRHQNEVTEGQAGIVNGRAVYRKR